MLSIFIILPLPIGKPGDKTKISGVTVTPDPPVKGQEIEVKATITLGKCVHVFSLIVMVSWSVVGFNLKSGYPQ